MKSLKTVVQGENEKTNKFNYIIKLLYETCPIVKNSIIININLNWHGNFVKFF